MVKLAVTSQPPGGLKALVDPRFGRASIITLVDVEGGVAKNVEVMDNPARNEFGGAGPAAAQFMANMGVNAVLTCNIGPKAHTALSALGIKVYIVPQGVTVEEAVKKYVSGELTPASTPTGPAYMGMGPGWGGGKGRAFRGGYGGGPPLP